MEAKDTVMDDKQKQKGFDKLLAELKKQGFTGLSCDKVDKMRDDVMLKAQAEISFKAGRDEERKDIIGWLGDLGADEYMIAKLNNEMIIKSLSIKPRGIDNGQD